MSRNLVPVDGRDVLRAVKRAIREPYAWPGGYPVYVTMDDGALLCTACARTEFRLIAAATLYGLRDGWRAAGADVLWEGAETCAHCGTALPSAYGEGAQS